MQRKNLAVQKKITIPDVTVKYHYILQNVLCHNRRHHRYDNAYELLWYTTQPMDDDATSPTDTA